MRFIFTIMLALLISMNSKASLDISIFLKSFNIRTYENYVAVNNESNSIHNAEFSVTLNVNGKLEIATLKYKNNYLATITFDDGFTIFLNRNVKNQLISVKQQNINIKNSTFKYDTVEYIGNYIVVYNPKHSISRHPQFIYKVRNDGTIESISQTDERSDTINVITFNYADQFNFTARSNVNGYKAVFEQHNYSNSATKSTQDHIYVNDSLIIWEFKYFIGEKLTRQILIRNSLTIIVEYNYDSNTQNLKYVTIIISDSNTSKHSKRKRNKK